jgi:hypothetical protein
MRQAHGERDLECLVRLSRNEGKGETDSSGHSAGVSDEV